MPFTDARNRLSELIDEVTSTHERIEITKHGRGAHLCRRCAALEETLEALSSAEAMRQLATPLSAAGRPQRRPAPAAMNRHPAPPPSADVAVNYCRQTPDQPRQAPLGGADLCHCMALLMAPLGRIK
ncbi:type II toxin-antitoxin system prevent-host-death family antitoxin [Micromonospora sp. NPDC049081]|uniref:type II toxin-antitoxin system Phd/YefM family antitoxin n=1 Tax=Micromonospora sp. NPDC049081 TaxID=3155150 RepID=UPI0033F8B8CD